MDDVDLRDGTVRVRHNLTCADRLKPPKSAAGVRDVPMPRCVGEVVAHWRDHHWRPEPRRLMVRTGSGRPIASAGFHRHLWHPLLASAGLGAQGYHFHALRAFAASWWVDISVPITTVALARARSAQH